MALRSLEGMDPREARSLLHASYDRYISGIDTFPRAHFKPWASVDHFPLKTQPIVATLLRAWGNIRQDRAWFVDGTTVVVNMANQATGKEPWHGLSIVRIGYNAVSMAMVSKEPEHEAPKVEIHESRRDEFIEHFGGTVLKLGGNEAITLAGDMLKANPDVAPVGLVVRDSNVSAIYVATQYAEAS